MALAYLFDPCKQWQNRAGVNNVSGYIEVFIINTDTHATVYTDFTASAVQPAHIGIDNDGRAVMVVDADKVYRVEMHDPSGNLIFTQQPVYPVKGGSGQVVNSFDVVSTDGSINVEASTSGNTKTFDISIPEDGNDLLEWIRCDGSEHLSDTDTYRPQYTDGTMEVGEIGIVLQEGQLYHATVHIRATKNETRQPFDDKVDVLFKLYNGTEFVNVTRQSVIVDYSTATVQDFEVSTDVKAPSDCELAIDITSQDIQGGDFELLNLEVHRVYSGAPSIPTPILTRERADELYQPIITPGRNINITDNVLSYAPTRAWRSMHGSTWCDCGDCFGFLVDDNYYDPDNLITVEKGTFEDSEHNVTHWGNIHIAAGHAAIVVTSLTLLRIPGELQPTLNSIALWYGGNPVSIYGARHEFLYDNSQSNEVVPQIVGYFPATENGATISLGCSAGTTWYYYKPTELWVAVLD